MRNGWLEQENAGKKRNFFLIITIIFYGCSDTQMIFGTLAKAFERGGDSPVEDWEKANREIERLQKTVAELQRKQDELESHAEMFRLLAENSMDGFWRLDEQMRFLYVSPAAQDIFGLPCEEVIGRPLFDFLTPESVETVKQGYAKRQPLQEKNKSWESSVYTVEVFHRDGRRIWVEVAVNPIFDADNHLIGYNGITRDINERRLREEAMRRYAFYDPLTNLPNRRMFEEVLGHSLEQNRPQERPLAVLFLDVDGLKRVNDQYGHGFGDTLLQVAAERFRHAIRQQDFVARLAGDEFMIILQDIGDKNAVALIADRLVESCREPISLAQHQVCVGVSIGISFFPTDADTVTALMSRADQAMYRAKETGGGCYVCYGQEN